MARKQQVLALVPAPALPSRHPVGARVTCDYRGRHEGTVLAHDDPRCWGGSVAFPDPSPAQAAVTRHVEWCYAQGLLLDEKQPVLWDFGKIYWDRNLKVRQ